MIQTIIAFLIVIGVLIFFHELGHFLVARLVGVKVLVFSLGFGPKLIGRRIGETEYQVSIFPLGGYVKLLGEEEEKPSSETATPLSADDRLRSFTVQPLWKRVLIVGAGPVFNLVLAYLIFTAILAGGFGVFAPRFDSLLPIIETVMEDSPAMKGGLQSGDRVISIDGQKIAVWNQMTEIIQNRPNERLGIEVKRNGQISNLFITPELVEVEASSGEMVEIGRIGVSKGMQDSTVVADNPLTAIYKGLEATWRWTELTVVGISKLITRQISAENIGGPILIAQMSGRAAAEGMMNAVIFIAILSVNLGVINLLPIPVLDGGHLFFFLIEAIRGRPLSVRQRGIAQQVGLYLLILLMGLALYNDVVRLFTVQG